MTLDKFREATIDKNLRKCKNLEQWLTESGCFDNCYGARRYELLASDANLPGTNMQVVQEVGSRQGIRERFAGQRQYTDISVSFYVTHDYASLRFFQEWINFMNPIYLGREGVTYDQSSATGYPEATEETLLLCQRERCAGFPVPLLRRQRGPAALASAEPCSG